MARGTIPWKRWVTAAFVLLPVATAAHGVRLPVTAYTPEEGLASQRVLRIVLDSRGFLWFCTPDGLSHFDGQRFTTYSIEEGLPVPAVNDLLETRDGIYWVATNGGGLAWFDRSRRWTPTSGDGGRLFSSLAVQRGPGRGHDRVNVIFEDDHRRLWAGTDAGLFASAAEDGVRDPGSTSFEPVPLGVPGHADAVVQVWSIVESPEGVLWIGTSAGLVRRFADGARAHFPIRPAEGADHVFGLLLDPEGRLWIGHDTGLYVLDAATTAEGGPGSRTLAADASLCLVDDGANEVLDLPSSPGDACTWRPHAELIGAAVYDLLPTPDGRIQIATNRGLAEYDGRTIRRISTTSEVDNSGIRALALDPSGNLWMGTSSFGAFRLMRHGFLTYTSDDGLAAPVVDHVFSGGDGEIYVLTREFMLHRFDGDRFVAVRPRLPDDLEQTGRSRFLTPYRDRSGQWWFGTGRGLFRFPAVGTLEDLAEVGPVARYTVADGLAGNDIRYLYEDVRGDLWIGTRLADREVLTRWDRRTGELHRYGVDDGLPPGNHPNSFAEDRQGDLWIGFAYGGLARFRNGGFRFYEAADGVPEGGISVLLPAPGGGLWIGSGRGHLVHLDGITADGLETTSLLPVDGIPVSRFRCLTASGDGQLYVGTGRGLLRIDPETRRVERFGVADGLGSGWIRACTHDRRGDLWVATAPGLSRLRSRSSDPPPPPPVWISAVEVDGSPRPASALGEADPLPLELVGSDHRVRIEYFGASFAPGEVLRYETHLGGSPEEWSPPRSEHGVIYANLSPGTYRFAVRAVTASGVRSAEAAELPITVLPPVWRRPWVLAVATLVLGTALFFAHRLRVRRAVELERVRIRIAADLHDDVGSGLARISILSEVAGRRTEDADAASFMHQIGESARSLLHATDDIVWAIDPREETVAGLGRRLRRFASDLLGAEGIDWSLDIAETAKQIALSPEQRRHLLLGLKEALHNVVRHSRATRVRMSIGHRRQVLLVEIEDDGVGFPITHGRPEPDVTGHGIDNMRRRLAELGGALTIDSTPGRGTLVRFVASISGRGA